jgi:hypothetical protein
MIPTAQLQERAAGSQVRAGPRSARARELDPTGTSATTPRAHKAGAFSFPERAPFEGAAAGAIPTVRPSGRAQQT